MLDCDVAFHFNEKLCRDRLEWPYKREEMVSGMTFAEVRGSLDTRLSRRGRPAQYVKGGVM